MIIRVLSICWTQLLIVSSLSAQEARISRIFAEENTPLYSEATASYLEWIAQAASPDVRDLDALKKHLRWIALLAPEDTPVRRLAYLLTDGRGTHEDANTIVSWWHQQDPLPATFYNERIEEHLYRVYYAERNYADRRDSLGVDDRGRIFVRFGRPWKESVISLKNFRLKTLPLEYRLPKNEIWVYRGIHDDAHYLFVQMSRRRPYQIATSESLIPSSLRGTRRRVDILLAWMEDIFGQLAMEHDHYGAIYDAVVNYTTLPTSEPLRPYEFSQKAIQDTRVRDDQQQMRRAESIPISTTNIYGHAVELDPQVRFTRFLERDGSTRLETYWSVDVRDVQPSRYMVRRVRQLGQEVSDDFIVSAGLTTRGANFEPQDIQIRRYHLPQGSNTEPRVYSWMLSDYGAVSSIAMQWSLHWTVPDSIPPQPDAAWAIGIAHLDTLNALNGSGTSLEVSDLKPLLLESPDAFDRAVPYLERKIRSDTPFALYFETYFLRFSETDRTNYTIAYSLTGQEEAPITTTFEYEGDSATVREFIAIDFDQWRTPGPCTLTLTVTDLVAGTSAFRSIDLHYVE